MLPENAIAKEIVDVAYKIHTTLGPGLLESAYERIFVYELQRRGFAVKYQVCIPIRYGDLVVDAAFRADFIVNDLVIVELKSVEKLERVHYKQLLTYLKLADKRLGLLINFGAEYIKDGIHRIANELPNEEDCTFNPAIPPNKRRGNVNANFASLRLCVSYAMISLTTCPATSVNRKSRPA